MSLTFNLQKFIGLFPNSSTNSKCLEYTVQDSDYRVYNPVLKGTELSFTIDHIRGGATDDNVNLLLTFNPDGSVKQLSGDWKAGNQGYTIPPIVVTAVDTAAAVFAATTAPETLGISAVAMAAAVGAFDIACVVVNRVSPFLVKLSDDGGRLYTLAVVYHAVNRACSAVSA